MAFSFVCNVTPRNNCSIASNDNQAHWGKMKVKNPNKNLFNSSLKGITRQEELLNKNLNITKLKFSIIIVVNIQKAPQSASQ